MNMELSLLLQHTFTLNLSLQIEVKVWSIDSFYFSSSARIDPILKNRIYCIIRAYQLHQLPGQTHQKLATKTSWWLNHPSEKYDRQIGSSPQGSGVNIKNVWNHLANLDEKWHTSACCGTTIRRCWYPLHASGSRMFVSCIVRPLGGSIAML